MPKARKPDRSSQKPPQRPSQNKAALKEVDEALARLDTGIAEERKQMEALLARLRTPGIAA